MKQKTYHGRKGREGLSRLLSAFVTLCLVTGLVPSGSIAYARDSLTGVAEETDAPVAVVAEDPSASEPEAEAETATDEADDESASEGAVDDGEPEEAPAGEAADDAQPEEPVSGGEAPEEAAGDVAGEKAEALPVGELTAEAGGATVTASYDEGAFEKPVTLNVREIKQGDDGYARVEGGLDALADARDDFGWDAARAFDIAFVTEDGAEVEPKSAVRVRISLGGAVSEGAADADLVHIPDGGEAELVEGARVASDGSTASFESDEFSIYVVTAKDAASYEVGGTGYDSLSAAINAITDSGTIWVTENKTEGGFTIPAGKDIVLKTANDATLSVSGQVVVDGALEINDGITINNTVNNGPCIKVSSGGSLAVKGGKVASNKTNSGTISNSGKITEISGGEISVNKNGTSAINNYGTIKLITGNANIHSTGNSNSNAINGGIIEVINGGIIESENAVTISNSKIGKIAGGRIVSSYGAAINTNKVIDEISGSAEIQGTTFGIFITSNRSSIGEIAGGKITATGGSGSAVSVNKGASIGTISGGTLSGASAGLNLSGASTNPTTVGSIQGGEFYSTATTSNALKIGGYATVSNITGGTFSSKGSCGISVEANGALDHLKGGVVIEGKTNAIKNSGTLGLEDDIVSAGEAMGNVRYKTNSNTPASQVSPSSAIPAGYHMSTMLDNGYHYLVKDNTVIYDGNGSTTADGKTRVSIAGESATVTVASNTDAGFDIPAGYTTFTGWNTKADGTGTPYAAGSSATVPTGEELLLYAQWSAEQPINVTVKHSFDHLVDPTVTSQFTWRSDPTVSENIAVSGPISPKELFSQSTAYQHVGFGIATADGGSPAIGGEMKVDLTNPMASYPLTYKLTGVKVNGSAVTDLESTIGFDEDGTVEFAYELVPIDITIDYNADVTGVYKGTAYSVNRADMNLTLTGSDNASYLVSPIQTGVMFGEPQVQSWTVKGSRIVVGSGDDTETKVMPTNPMPAYFTSDLDSSTWTENADGTYKVPGNHVKIDYNETVFHGVNYSDKALPSELFNVSYKPVTIKVTPKALTITVSDQTHIANGSPQGEDNASYTNKKNENASVVTEKLTVEGLVSGDYIRSFKLNGTETEVGTYSNKIAASDIVIGRVVSGKEYGRTNCYDITLVAGKLTIESNETTYTVKHFQQNVNDDNYTEVTADTKTTDGAIGDEVTPEVKTYEGFTSPAALTITLVKESGSNLVEYKYDRKQITATFDKNGGDSVDPASKTGKYGAKLGTLPEATWANGVFDGWYTAADGGTKITANTTLPAENVTYYAHWKEYVYQDVQTGEKFTALQDAFNAANDGDTIIPLKDYAESTNATVPAGKNVTLDTSGHTLTVNGSINVNGGLTIGDGLTVKGSGTTMNVSAGGNLIMNGGSLLSSGGNGLRVQGTGATATLNNFEKISGSQAGITATTGGTITKIDGTGTVTAADSGNAWPMWIQSGGHVGEIAGATFDSSSNPDAPAVMMFSNSSSYAVIDKISGGTFNGGEAGLQIDGNSHVGEISNGTFTGSNGIQVGGGTGEKTVISGGTFTGTSGYGMLNTSYANTPFDITGGTFKGSRVGIGNMGTINVITDATIEGGWAGIDNSGGIGIGEIKGETKVTGNAENGTAIYNAGTITTITNGTFTGGASALQNTFTVTNINGGTFEGSAGIDNTAGSTIESINVAKEGDLVVNGTDGPAVQNAGKATITGKGIYIGKDNAIENVDGGTTKLEPGLTAPRGYGRYQTSGNTSGSQLEGNVTIPDGYHMSQRTTTSTEDGTFHYLVKNNTVMYDGNGHDPKDGVETIDGRVYDSGENPQVEVKDNEFFDSGDKVFVGWNTEPGGTGDTYKPGSTITVPEGAERLLYAQWKYPVTVTANDASKTYDSKPLTESGFTTTKLADGDTHTFAVLMTEGSTITNAGTQPNVIATVDGVAVSTESPTIVGDYYVTVVNGTLTVNPKAVTITAKDAEKTYDSEPLTEPGFTATALEPGDAHTFAVVMTEGSTITNAGTKANVIATVDGTDVETGIEKRVGNYLVTTVDGTLSIGKAPLTITANDQEHVYDGNVKGEGDTVYASPEEIAKKVRVEGLKGTDAVTSVTLDGQATFAGEYEDAIVASSAQIGEDGALTGNYSITYVPGKLTITESSITYSVAEEDATKGTVSNGSESVGKKDYEPVGSTAQPNEGYHFVNWTDDNAEGAEVSTDAAFNPGKNLPGAFTAHFAPNKYTIKLDANSGSGEMDPVTATYDEPQSLPENGYKKPGYTFTGWNTEPDGSGTGYADKAEVLNLASEDGATVTLYAQWAPNDSRISYNANGGEGETADTEGKTDEVVKVAESGFTREGHTFVGWNTEPDGSGKACQPGDDFTLLPEATVLYAQWDVNQYTIVFDPNGGTYEGTAEPTAETHDYGDVITMRAPERDGYTFLYWKGSEYYVGDEYTVTEDHTFVAQWEKSEEPKPSPKPTPKPSPKPTPKKAIPQTGDPAAAMPLALFAGTGLGLLLAAAVLRRRRA